MNVLDQSTMTTELAEIDRLNTEAWELRLQDPERIRVISSEALERSRNSNYDRGIAEAERSLGHATIATGDITLGKEHLRKAVQLFEALGDLRGLSQSLIELGRGYHLTGEYDRALDLNAKALQFARRSGDQRVVASAHVNLGNAFCRIDQNETGKKHYVQAQEIAHELGDERLEASALANLGLIESAKKNHPLALDFSLRVLPIFERLGRYNEIANVHANIGITYRELGDLENAVKHHMIALSLAEENQLRRVYSSVMMDLGETYRAMGQYTRAIEYLQKGCELAEQENSKHLLLEAHRSLSLLFEQLGDFKLALEHERLHSQYKAEMLDIRAKSTAAAIEMRLKIEQGEKERELLEFKNDELKRFNQHLTELNEQKDEVLRIVSHDIRNPLGAIIGMGNLLHTEDQVYADEVKDHGAFIEQTGQRLLGLVNNLLDVSRIESGSLKLERIPTDIGLLLEEASRVVDPLVTKKGITLEMESEAGDRLLLIDAPKIGQVLGNLLSNAVKFTARGGAITVHSSYRNERLSISVKDSGVGMSERELSHLYEKFGPHQRPGTGGEIGSGLGMPIVKRFVELHGGEINVVSAPGEGTCITCIIPAPEYHWDSGSASEPSIPH